MRARGPTRWCGAEPEPGCRWRAALVFFATLCGGLLVERAAADVVVLANRSPKKVTCRVESLAGIGSSITLKPREVMPLFLDGRARLSFTPGREPKRYLLDANSVYYFGLNSAGQIDLQQIGLGSDSSTNEGRTLPGNAASARSAVVPVVLYVDEEEPATRKVWEPRLRKRIEAASALLDRYCRVRLQVVGIGKWQTDNATNDFFSSLSEFEREVKPKPGQLAIGFTSQYQMTRGRTHMAGTRGPLHTHILVREWSRHVSEPERLELLVHELGHFLGASHSPERDSAMRPVVGNRQAVRVGFQVRFDPVNTLIMSMVGEELSRRKIRRIREISEGSRLRLRQIYTALRPTLPEDPATGHFIQLLGGPSRPRSNRPGTGVAKPDPLVLATKQVVAQIVLSAKSSRAPQEGDKRTEFFVQRAAGMAQMLPEDLGANAFLLGLGIALDDSDFLRQHGAYGRFVRSVESDFERQRRIELVGQPTIWGRRDLTKHFVVSAYLTASSNGEVANTLGIAKELSDANGGSGFSFADVAANRAGIRFAEGTLAGRLTLRAIFDDFALASHMVPIDGLVEGLQLDDLIAQFGTQEDERFGDQLRQIDARFDKLAPSRKSKP